MNLVRVLKRVTPVLGMFDYLKESEETGKLSFPKFMAHSFYGWGSVCLAITVSVSQLNLDSINYRECERLKKEMVRCESFNANPFKPSKNLEKYFSR